MKNDRARQECDFCIGYCGYKDVVRYFSVAGKVGEPELKDCMSGMKSCVAEVRVIYVDKGTAWYLCKPFISN